MKLGVEGYAPALLRKITSQGGRYAFSEAAGNLKELAGLDISGQHVMRLTERIGAEWQARRSREILAFNQNLLPRNYPQAPTTAAVMLDGGRVQTRQEPSGPGVTGAQWNEPKYGCFLTLNTKPSQSDPQAEPPSKFSNRESTPKLVREIQSQHGGTPLTRSTALKNEPVKARTKKRKRISSVVLRTVIATMCGVTEFGAQVALEVYKRGLDLARHKACVCDGQKSNWTVWEAHLKPLGFIPVLDFLHLLTYLYAAAQARGGTEQQRWERYVKWMTWAWQGMREKVLVALKAACRDMGEPPGDAPENDPRAVLSKACTYVVNNIEKMDYPRYRKLGLPVSSAPIESTIKQFNKRVKGTEKFWKPSAVEAVLQMRAAQLCQDNRVDCQWHTPRAYRAARHTPIKKVA